MHYNELRKDYLLNRWVVIAKERSKRPSDLAKPHSEPAKTGSCPLCVGHEHQTPPANIVYQQSPSGAITKTKDPPEGERTKNWQVRGFANLYPAFSPPQKPQDTAQIFVSPEFGYAIGYHEVLTESPSHDWNPAESTQAQLELVVEAYIERFKALADKSYVKYVSIFRNYGLDAGASLAHPHSQIIAIPMLSTVIAEEQQATKAYQQAHGKCAICDIAEREIITQRGIYQNNDFVVIAPYASVHPLEFWIIPKRHTANIASLTDSEIKNLAATLKVSLKALKDVVNDPPYNFGIHQSIGEDGYHWHLEVYPKLAQWAGFEKSTGIYINTVLPEYAAEALKKAIKP
jgi:UDPglucose--hexose-1-phosphate uridylyltransferase